MLSITWKGELEASRPQASAAGSSRDDSSPCPRDAAPPRQTVATPTLNQPTQHKIHIRYIQLHERQHTELRSHERREPIHALVLELGEAKADLGEVLEMMCPCFHMIRRELWVIYIRKLMYIHYLVSPME